MVFSFSDTETERVFRVEQTTTKRNVSGDTCVRLKISFSPEVGQTKAYTVYGKPSRGSESWKDRIYYKGNRLQLLLGNEVIDLVPVMGVGVSRDEWDNQIAPSGWRYSGFGTYRRFPSQEDQARALRYNKPIEPWEYGSMADFSILGRKMFGLSFNHFELQELQLDQQGFPSFPPGKQLLHEGLNPPLLDHAFSRQILSCNSGHYRRAYSLGAKKTGSGQKYLRKTLIPAER